MRDIVKIMDQMIPHATNKEQFTYRTSKLKDSVAYTPPEALYLRWTQLHEYMIEDIPEDEKDWTEDNYNMVSVFTGRNVDELKNYEE